MVNKTIKQKLKEYLDYAIILIITFSIGLVFFGLLPIHECNQGIINYSCSMWGPFN